MVVHSPPLQGSQDVGSIDGSVVPKDLEAPDYLIHGSKVTPDLTSASREAAATVCEHFLLLSFPLLHVPFECLTSMLLFLSLVFLTVGGFMYSGDENFLLSWSALASATPTTTPVHTSALPCQLVTFPSGSLSLFFLGPKVQGTTFILTVPSCCSWHPSAGQTVAALSPKGWETA